MSRVFGRKIKTVFLGSEVGRIFIDLKLAKFYDTIINNGFFKFL